MTDGWIKVHRRMLESAVWRYGSSDLVRVWVWCLLKAAYREEQSMVDGEVALLLPGEFITGRFKGALENDMPASTFRDQLATLVKLGNIRQRSNTTCTTITVVNWSTYQLAEGDARQPADSQPTASRQPADSQPTLLTRSKEDKKERKEMVPQAAQRHVFEPPSKSDIWAYAKEIRTDKKYNINDAVLTDWCANFHDYNIERDWILNNGKKMVDWLAALRRWIRLDYAKLTKTRKQ